MRTPKPRRPIDTGRIIPNPVLRCLYRPFQPLVEAAFGFPALWRLHDAAVVPGADAPGVAARLMAELGVTWEIPDADIARLKTIDGPLLLLSNHPFGGIDAFAIIALLEQIRPGGWKMLSNALMCDIGGLGENALAVDPIGSGPEVARANRRGMRAAFAHLKRGGALAMFPAGRVSHHPAELGAVCDREWSEHALRLAGRAGGGCAVLHIPGQNSARFLRVAPHRARFRALMLCRELTHPPRERVELRLAALYGPAELARLGRGGGAAGADKLRAACYWRADLDIPRPAAAAGTGERSNPPLADTAPGGELVAEAARLAAGEQRVAQTADYDLYFARGDDMPALLQELGRAREFTFRHAGQGAGKASDLSPEDGYYHHLLLWDRERGRLAGAYRVGRVGEIVARHGTAGLYLDHVFEIDPGFYPHLGLAFELSRSFVLPDYQRDRGALAALWKGLGAAAVRDGARTLFGSVTVSNDHHPASRALLVEHLRRNYADAAALRALVRARRPFAPATRYHELVADAYAGAPIDALAPLIDTAEHGERGIPPLMRYYCALGARYLSYHVEKAFQDALYCLLRIDLETIPAGYKRRFLGG